MEQNARVSSLRGNLEDLALFAAGESVAGEKLNENENETSYKITIKSKRGESTDACCG